MGAYNKLAVSAISAALVAAQTVLSKGGPVTSAEWLTIVDAVLGAALVYAVPNTPAADTTSGAHSGPL